MAGKEMCQSQQDAVKEIAFQTLQFFGHSPDSASELWEKVRSEAHFIAAPYRRAMDTWNTVKSSLQDNVDACTDQVKLFFELATVDSVGGENPIDIAELAALAMQSLKLRRHSLAAHTLDNTLSQKLTALANTSSSAA